MHSALAGKYRLFRMSERFNKRPLPEVLIADMKEELKNGNART
jgi:primosomal protein N'